jgi:Ca2+-binding EF-hand superfamily protein
MTFAIFEKDSLFISMLELMSALVIFGRGSLPQKVYFIQSIFDFDGNSTISLDEMLFMVSSIINAIGRMTDTLMPSEQELVGIARHIFKAVDVDLSQTL